MEPIVFTKIQQAIWNILADAEPHKRGELVASFTDEVSGNHVLDNHLTAIRKLIRPRNLDIICQFIKRSNHVRLIRLDVSIDSKLGK